MLLQPQLASLRQGADCKQSTERTARASSIPDTLSLATDAWYATAYGGISPSAVPAPHSIAAGITCRAPQTHLTCQVIALT